MSGSSDIAQNSAGKGAEALYVNALVVPAGSDTRPEWLEPLYTRFPDRRKGHRRDDQRVAERRSASNNAIAPGSIASAGQVDDWTFYGWAGDSATVVVNPGGGTPAPLLPLLNYASVQVFDPERQPARVVEQLDGGAVITLADLTLPIDGTYDVDVQAASGKAASVGQYLIGEYDSTVRVAAVTFGQSYTSTLASPYDADRWTFTAAAAQQIQFSSINSTSSGLQYTLNGPNGYSESDVLTTNGGLVTLPSSGGYTFSVTANGSQPGSYAFLIDLMTQSNLALGTTYLGTLSGSASRRSLASTFLSHKTCS